MCQIVRGTEREVVARLPQPPSNLEAPAADLSVPEPRGRGRPKLGVVAREVTLLPRHWEWLGTHPSGPSVALRRLVRDARRSTPHLHPPPPPRTPPYPFMPPIPL